MPVLLVYRLWKAEAIKLPDYWDLSKRALDFIADFGPWTAQERWEENFGASPSTIAAEIAALWVGADLAEAMGDHERAQKIQGDR
jgi:glucoamylase